jgi:hypothetical protein
MTNEDISNRFSYHPPTPGQVHIYEAIRGQVRNLAEFLNELCPEGRDKATAITKLEEVMFWANASVARNGPPIVRDSDATT